MKMSVKAALRNNPSNLCATIPAVSVQQFQQYCCSRKQAHGNKPEEAPQFQKSRRQARKLKHF